MSSALHAMPDLEPAPPANDPLSGALVPRALMPFVEILGLDDAVSFSRVVGLSRVNVPVDPSEGDELVRLAGMDTARRLSAAMAGERVYVPFCRAFLIRYLRARGRTVPEVSRLLKCSEGHVYRAMRSDT